MKTTKHTTGRNRPDHGLTKAERDTRFRTVAGSITRRLGARATPGPRAAPPTAADAHVRALGVAKRVAKVRPAD